jgi:hypothetical protein
MFYSVKEANWTHKERRQHDRKEYEAMQEELRRATERQNREREASLAPQTPRYVFSCQHRNCIGTLVAYTIY